MATARKSPAKLAAILFLLGLFALAAGSVALADSPLGQGNLVGQAVDGAPTRGPLAADGGVEPDHSVWCSAGSSYVKWSSTYVTFNSATQAGFIVDWIGVMSTLQKRQGSWPFYWWSNVTSTGWHDVPYDDYAGIAGDASLSAGRYRVKGDHYCTLYFHVPERVSLTSYSGEFNLP